MKKILITLLCSAALASAAFGQTHSQSLAFNDGVGTANAGTYNSTDSFSFDISLTFAGYSSYGLSLWFETTGNAASALTITNFTYGTTFADPNQSPSFPLAFTQSETNGQFTTPNPSDLGATVTTVSPPNAVGPGTYFVGHITISINGLAPGTYVLESSATNPHASEVADTTFSDNDLPNALYTITIVPEPSTYALLALTAVLFSVVAYRRRALRS